MTDNSSIDENKKIRDFIDLYKEDPTWWIHKQQLTNSDLQLIAEELKTNKKCKDLNLASNSIGEIGLVYILEILKVNKTLKELFLNDNQLGDEGTKSICAILIEKKKTNKLRSLGLGMNQVTDQSVEIIMRMVNEHQTLKLLDLRGNEFSQQNRRRLEAVALDRIVHLML